VLSTFMISDEIEVTTCHPDDAQARRLSLRSLHGKYLVRLIDKDASDLPRHVLPHGTQIRLKVRPSAELKDLTQVLKSWIMFPRCKVTVILDGAAPVTIGFLEPKDALTELLVSRGLLRGGDSSSVNPPGGTVRIEQRTKRGVSLAYAVEWSSYFKEWSFVLGDEYSYQLQRRQARDANSALIATCVEGISVSSGTPGFQGFGLLAIANAVGAHAPKTNVARSALEETAERKELMKSIYELYCEHVKAEVQALQKSRSFSLSWAVEEASWLLDPLFGHVPALDAKALTDASADVPCIALEEDNSRIAVSPKQLSERSSFWTVDGAFFSSAEALLKEVPTSVAMSRLIETIGTELLQMPNGPYISGSVRRRMVQRLVFGKREVDKIVVHLGQRRVDLRWSNVSEAPIWVTSIHDNSEAERILAQLTEEHRRYTSTFTHVDVAQRQIEATGLGEEVAIKSVGRTFVLPGTDYAKYLLALFKQIEASPSLSLVARYVIAIDALEAQHPIANASEFVQQRLVRMPVHVGIEKDSELAEVLQKTKFAVFDPGAWARDVE
jgi:molecular chaperone HtpG